MLDWITGRNPRIDELGLHYGSRVGKFLVTRMTVGSEAYVTEMYFRIDRTRPDGTWETEPWSLREPPKTPVAWIPYPSPYVAEDRDLR